MKHPCSADLTRALIAFIRREESLGQSNINIKYLILRNIELDDFYFFDRFDVETGLITSDKFNMKPQSINWIFLCFHHEQPNRARRRFLVF
jgi:hypothetical protein